MRAATPQAPRRLIVNADDFGFTPGVTAGILEAHAAGTVTSTSMMVRCAGWDKAVRQSRATPTLGVGLHLNLLVGAPLVPAPSLTDARSGRFASLATLVRRALAGRIDGAEVRAECEAQLAALREAGVRCTHIDSHRHVHALPVIRQAVAASAAALGLPLRRAVESHFRAAGGVRSQLHRALIGMSWRLTSAGAPRTRATDHFIGVSMQGSRHFARHLVAAIDHLSSGTTEIMVHPGHVDAALGQLDGYTWPRERELAALVSPELRERLRRGDPALIGFGAL
ncbi:MAG: carbohydrate deacetylase [Gemmatimonadales bacterium]